MRKIFFPLVWLVIAAMPVFAQQASPNVTAPAPQQTAQPKPARARPPEQPKVQPTPAVTTKNDLGKRTDHNPAKTNDNRDNYADAMRRYRHERHEQDWWKRHYVTIVLVGGGYYYWDAGYWCPAWGFDPNYERYDYDGPIYTYGNLLPDQVIVNVQKALKELGYYAGDVTGSLNPGTRRALATYQQDVELDATGVVDEPTVRALGLI